MAEKDPLSGEGSPKPLVVVIDNDHLLRWAIAQAASEIGYETIDGADIASVAAGAERLERQPTVILLDCDAGEADDAGLAALRARFPTVDFVVMTDDPFGARSACSFVSGAAILVKPFDLVALQAYLRWAARRRLEEGLPRDMGRRPC
jgi:DNA-binding response OmpR family regulator